MDSVEGSQSPDTPCEAPRRAATRRKRAGLLAVVALIGALVAALMLPTSGIAAETDEPEKTRRPGHGARGAGLTVAADALGVSNEDLRAALKSGRSIADVAGEKGIPTQTVIDAMVAAAGTRLETAVTNGRITQERADARAGNLPKTIKAFVEGTRTSGMQGTRPSRMREKAGRGPGRGPRLEAAAGAIGISTEDLRTALKAGKSIAEVAEENGVAPQTVIDAVVAERRSQVQNGPNGLEERVKAMVERKRPTAG